MSSIEELKFDKKNFNKHTEYGMSLLEKSLREFGAGRSVLVDKDDNIIAGNGIVESAANAGITRTRVVETTGDELVVVKRIDVVLDSKKGRRMAFADNATASADLEWDNENVKSELTKDDTDDWGVDIDWDEPEEVVEDEAPEVDETTADSELGKVYQLGRHRLMCGDSTNAEQVAILMDGKKADMVFTDPPYNMGYTGAGFLHKGHVEHMQKRLEKIIDFDANTISWLAKTDIPSIFIFTSKDLVRDYLSIFNNYSYNILVWHKTGVAPFKASSWIPDIEYLLYFHQKGHKWNGDLPVEDYSKLYSSTIKEGRKDAGGDLHPTIKPLNLICRELKICSDGGDIILDLFGGSGSTLIACEQTGRKCYMMELDPHYCDVIRKRYWKLTTGSEEGWQEGTKAQ